MVGLLFAFMPVLSHQPGQELDRADVFRLLIKCAPIHVTPDNLFFVIFLQEVGGCVKLWICNEGGK